MARYLFRLSILGPRALDAAQVSAAVDDAFRRLGFATEPATITNIKGIAPPTLRMVDRETGASAYIATVPPWGEIELDFSTAAQNVRTLTQASIVIHGTLPPTSASGRSGSAQVSNAVFAAVNAGLGPLGYFNLTGAGREAGLVASGGASWLPLLAIGAAGVVMYSKQKRGGMGGLGGWRRREAARLRKRSARYRWQHRYIAAKRLEREANRISR